MAARAPPGRGAILHSGRPLGTPGGTLDGSARSRSAPTTPPLEGATYGSFAAACHYKDGTFVPAAAEKDCAPTASTGSAFNVWHPDLTTLHVWLWLHNPAGLYHGTNPLVQAYPLS